jgi:parvulin-like peptidyl-prolyl isomerase
MNKVRLSGWFGVAALVASLFSGAGISSGEVLDKVMVVVNDEVVTQREFDRAFQPVAKNFEANFKGDELAARMEDAKKKLMEQIINMKLAISIAKKDKVEVDQAELDKRVEKIKSYYGDEKTFLEALEDRGTTFTEFKKDISEQMMAQTVVDKEVAQKIVITPTEISELYDKNKDKLISPKTVKLWSIMVRKSEDAAADKKKMEDIIAKLNAGEDFSEVAKKYSEGPYAEKGGDMGEIYKGQLLKEMDDAVFSAEKGKLTPIVDTKIGLHVFKIEDIHESKQMELAEVNDFLKSQLFKKKFDEQLATWLEEKKKNAYIAYK